MTNNVRNECRFCFDYIFDLCQRPYTYDCLFFQDIESAKKLNKLIPQDLEV